MHTLWVVTIYTKLRKIFESFTVSLDFNNSPHNENAKHLQSIHPSLLRHPQTADLRYIGFQSTTKVESVKGQMSLTHDFWVRLYLSGSIVAGSSDFKLPVALIVETQILHARIQVLEVQTRNLSFQARALGFQSQNTPSTVGFREIETGT